MNDNQRTSVLRCIDRARGKSPAVQSGPTVRRACRALGVFPPSVRPAPSGMVATKKTIFVSEETDPVSVVHAVAHVATDSVFPAHGAEFCQNLLKAAQAVDPYLAGLLREEMDREGVHYTADHRRGAAIKAIVQRAADGTSRVEVVVDDPPMSVIGAMDFDRARKTVTVDGHEFSLDRVRYLSRVD